MQLEGKVAGVTGSGQGIGRAIALRLGSEGADVAVSDVNEDALKGMGEEILSKGRHSLLQKADVTKKEEVVKFVERIIHEFGRIDIWVNNAGIISAKPLLDLSEEEWDTVLDINLKGCFICSQVVGEKMKAQNSGRIINISSTGGKIGGILTAHYGASKAGVINLTKSLALLLAPYNVTVNAVCPGVIKTTMWEKLDAEITGHLGLNKGEALRRRINDVPLKRAGTPECIAGLVAYLASDEAYYITGQAINVDGGLIMY